MEVGQSRKRYPTCRVSDLPETFLERSGTQRTYVDDRLHQLAGEMFRRSSAAVATSREGPLAARLLLRVLGQLVVDGPHIADRSATLVHRAARPDPCLDVAVQLKEHSPSIAVVLPVDVRAPLHYFEKSGTIRTPATR